MPADTKTYWRIPGETGIPTEFDFAGIERRRRRRRSLWPYPRDRPQPRAISTTSITARSCCPIELAAPAGAGAALEAAITLGICSDICVPAQAKFSLPLDFGAPDAGAVAPPRPGRGARPRSRWDQPGRAVRRRRRPLPDGSRIAGLDPADRSRNRVIADVGDPSILFETPQKSPDGAYGRCKLLGGAGTKELGGPSRSIDIHDALGPLCGLPRDRRRAVAARPTNIGIRSMIKPATRCRPFPSSSSMPRALIDVDTRDVLGKGIVVLFARARRLHAHLRHAATCRASSPTPASSGRRHRAASSAPRSTTTMSSKAWAERSEALGKIDFIADAAGTFAEALGLAKDFPILGGRRYARFAMIIRDGVVESAVRAGRRGRDSERRACHSAGAAGRGCVSRVWGKCVDG